MRKIAIGVVLLIGGCASGCGGGSAVERTASGRTYGGPMTAEAAVNGLQCDGRKPYLRAEGSYDGGLESVQSSPERAFDDYVERSGIKFHVPVEGYRFARRQEHAALLSYEVGGRTRVAIFLADGIRDFQGDVGWGVVAWAQCDPAELPAEATEELNIGVWEDAAGRRIPARRVRSYQGAEHCDWTDITFLLIGPEDQSADYYVRDPRGELSQLLRGEFSHAAELPEGAIDTGWRRDGRQLWLGPGKEAAYLRSLEDPRDVERWPAAKERIGCA